MPLPSEMTPELVIASEPPNIWRVALSSQMPVPAVTTPVVDATTRPLLSVDSAAFFVLRSQVLLELVSWEEEALAKTTVDDAVRENGDPPRCSCVVVEFDTCPKNTVAALMVSGQMNVLIARGFVPEHVVPPLQLPEITPELVIAREPPKI